MAEPSTADYTCPLPVLEAAASWPTSSGLRLVRVRQCGAPLSLERTESEYLVGRGDTFRPVRSCGPTWRVECQNGHVLVVPDNGASDDFDRIPFHQPSVDLIVGDLTAAGLTDLWPPA